MRHFAAGSGKPVVFLHGLPTNGNLWHDVVKNVTGVRSYVVDLPGMERDGRYTGSGIQLEDWVARLESMRVKEAISTWTLVGHDAGSTLAVLYSARYPERVRRLILCSPPLVRQFQPPLLFRVLRMPFVGEMLAPGVMPLVWRLALPSMIERRDVDANERVRSFAQPFVGIPGRRRFLKLLRWGDPIEVMSKVEDCLGRIAQPVLILHGSQDPAISQAVVLRAAQLLPNAYLRMLDCGHFVPIDRHEVVTEAVIGFARGPWRGLEERA